MIEDTDSSRGQFLRADHLFHVTLKYTRTGDVIKNTIRRLVLAMEFAMGESLERKKAKDIHELGPMRTEMMKKLMPKNKDVKHFIDFYNYLKKIDKGQFTIKEEYRKNVALVVDKEEISISKLKELLARTKYFMELSQEF